MQQRLIYDVGVNDGQDTSFYLSLGHRVVGIEASPTMIEHLRKRFTKEIQDGSFTLLNIGVAETDGELDFWVSEVSEWSSFHRSIASRKNTPHHKVSVQTRRFEHVIAEHGVPFYCKIDIEGNDRYCLMGLTTDTTPEYISIEMSHSDGGDDLKLLQGLGYDKFKLVSQVTRAQPIPLVTWLGHHLPGRLARAPRKLVRETIGVSRIGDWKFHYSSSGSFAEETPGPWRSYADVYAMWEKLRDIAARSKSKGLGEWFDFHATNARRT